MKETYEEIRNRRIIMNRYEKYVESIKNMVKK